MENQPGPVVKTYINQPDPLVKNQLRNRQELVDKTQTKHQLMAKTRTESQPDRAISVALSRSLIALRRKNSDLIEPISKSIHQLSEQIEINGIENEAARYGSQNSNQRSTGTAGQNSDRKLPESSNLCGVIIEKDFKTAQAEFRTLSWVARRSICTSLINSYRNVINRLTSSLSTLSGNSSELVEPIMKSILQLGKQNEINVIEKKAARLQLRWKLHWQ
ncbi:hypothetical protein BIW11_12565 [Tropilaelaps mercedesae]|uniref:Uncharacterized protein n=1 Tax=Tropilaelaps mercedesae TaxID=418985 RepID=A0A1V9X6F0_9ACAR|nr:hypothetical protein BIW11_12565 [Tropilaelaps mercedesae]